MKFVPEEDEELFDKARIEALERFDTDWFREMLTWYVGKLPSEKAFIISIHKARVEYEGVSKPAKKESRKWLSEHGFYPGISPEVKKQMPWLKP